MIIAAEPQPGTDIHTERLINGVIDAKSKALVRQTTDVAGAMIGCATSVTSAKRQDPPGRQYRGKK